jgi:hypothetical protein
MNAEAKRYKTTGRIAFHSNGGTTNIQLWVRAPQLLEIETEKIPASLRSIGTWVTIQFPPFEVIGPGEPQDWKWDEDLPGGPPPKTG